MRFEVNGQPAFASSGGKPFVAGRPTVLFVPGSGLDHSFWGLHSRFFAFRGYAVLCPDLPGHSHSGGEPLASIEAMADWLAACVKVMRAGPLSLVGHSQGCLVALEYAARHAEGLASVSFIASGLATPVNPALIEAARNDPDAAVGMMISWGFGNAGHLHQGPIPGNSMMAGGYRVMRRNAPRALAADLEACDAYTNGQAAAAAVACPRQVILGGHDRMAPRKAGMALVEHLREPEFHLLPEAGHMVPLEAPNACRALLRDFIFRHNPATPS